MLPDLLQCAVVLWWKVSPSIPKISKAWKSMIYTITRILASVGWIPSSCSADGREFSPVEQEGHLLLIIPSTAGAQIMPSTVPVLPPPRGSISVGVAGCSRRRPAGRQISFLHCLNSVCMCVYILISWPLELVKANRSFYASPPPAAINSPIWPLREMKGVEAG